MSRFESWSRRKRGLEEHAQPTPGEEETPGTADDALDATDPAQTAADDEVVAEGSLDDQLPAPETLSADSDFTSFLLPGVSPELKRRALRRMFSASHYNVRDGLDDYDQDFRQARKLSSEVAMRLRRWMDTLAEDSESAAGGDMAEPDAPRKRDATTAHHETEGRDDKDTLDTTQPDGDPSDPSRPRNGSV